MPGGLVFAIGCAWQLSGFVGDIGSARTRQRMKPATDRKRALVVSFSNLRTDPRVQRQITLLRHDFDLRAAGHADPGADGVEFFPVSPRHWSPPRKLLAAALLKAGFFEEAYWSSESVADAMRALRGRAFDLIIANDVWTLPLALKLRGAGKVLFDAHEYAPREFEDKWKWRFFFEKFNEYLCRRYIPMADASTTVSDGVAREYERNFGAPMTVIANAAPYHDLQPCIAADDRVIRLVHHGAAIPSRRLELMIEAMDQLDTRFKLDLVLMPSVPRYYDQMASLAKRRSSVRIVPPVLMHDLPRVLNTYDVGVFLLPPTNFNYRFALPNKFFEFVQARLAIAIGPSPEMAAFVNSYEMGIVSDDFTAASFARALSTLDRQRVNHFKARAHIAARDLCFEKAADVLLGVIHKALSN